MKTSKVTYAYFLLTLLMLTTACSKTNTIEGNIGYPSDYVPEMDVYLENVESGDLYVQTIAGSMDGESKYIFENIPDGEYIAYAVPIEEGVGSFIGGYTHAVPCGLSTECTNHEYISLEVKDGTHLTDINIYDWYMGDEALKRIEKYYI